MRLLKGKKIADKILKDLKRAIIKEKLKPGLAVVLVGEDKASKVYVGLKKKAAKNIGFGFYLSKFKENEKEAVILKKIKELNIDKKIHGIIIQLPLPKKFHTQKIIDAIDPRKDADGFSGKSETGPVFPKAIVNTLEFSRVNLKNTQSAIIVNSKIFGETMVGVLRQKGIRGQYILYKNYKKSLLAIKRADIIISAVGKPGFIKGDMIKNSAIIIDGGITKIGKKVMGDVDLESVKKKAACTSPVPGGVGPVTIACLLENVYLSSTFQKKK